MNAHDYNITIRRFIEDDQALFEARIRELPDVAEYADSAEEAYELAIDTIETLAEVHAEQDRELPPPHVPCEDYSGRVTLRVPKRLHRNLSIEAEEEGISLNQYLVAVLSYHSGAAFRRTVSRDAGWIPQVNDNQQPEKAKTQSHLKMVSSRSPEKSDGWGQVA